MNKFMDELKAGLANVKAATGNSAITDRVLTTQSLGEDATADAAGSLKSAVGTAIKTSAPGASASQIAAAEGVSLFAVDGGKTLTALSNSTMGYDLAATQMGADDVVVTNLAFDKQEADNALVYSIAYNLEAAGQDEYGEALYPTKVLAANATAIKVKSQITNIVKPVLRNVGGASQANDFAKIPLIKALKDGSIIGVDKNKLIPVLRDESKEYLLEEFKYTDETKDEAIETAPIKTGKAFNIVGASQTEAMLAAGMSTHTQAMDNAIALKDLYLEFNGKDASDAAVKSVVKTDVSMLAGTNFVPSVQGSVKESTLNLDTKAIKIVAGEANGINGDAQLKDFAGITAGTEIVLNVIVHGDAQREHGTIAVYSSSVTVAKVTDENGIVLSPTSAEFAAVVSAIGAMSVVGYTADAATTNSDLSSDGILLTNDDSSITYQVATRTPVLMELPVNADENIDTLIRIQATTVAARVSADSVTRAFAYLRMLENLSGIAEGNMKLLGVGQDVVKPTFYGANVNVGSDLNSISSASKREDITALLENRIALAIEVIMAESGYADAFRALKGTSAGKIRFSIGVDGKIASYLKGTTKPLNIGDYDFDVVSTRNAEAAGKIIVVPTIKGEEEVSGLSFGLCAWVPTINHNTNRTKGNATVKCIGTTPAYVHINSCPVGAILTVTGLEEAAAKIAQ